MFWFVRCVVDISDNGLWSPDIQGHRFSCICAVLCAVGLRVRIAVGVCVRFILTSRVVNRVCVSVKLLVCRLILRVVGHEIIIMTYVEFSFGDSERVFPTP